MNGVHDMGGMDGFGPVQPEKNEPLFHSEWESRNYGMQRCTGYLGLWNIDMTRASVEKLPPAVYLGSSYFARWALGLEMRLLQHGLIAEDELEAGHSLRPGTPMKRKLTAADVEKTMVRASYARPAPAPAQFKPGDCVRTRNLHPTTHTRLPRYARGKSGVIEAVRGCHVYPDSAAIGKGDDPHWLYTVLFQGSELWGERADPGLTVSIDAWEPYLEPA